MARTHHNTTRTFSHLTVFDRGQIQALRNQGKSLQEIADIIGCHKSTISRELKRGTVTQRRSDLPSIKHTLPMWVNVSMNRTVPAVVRSIS